MAELHVQPKKNTGWWLWLLLAFIAIALVYFLSKGCHSTADETAATGVTQKDSLTAGAAVSAASPNNEWDDIDFSAPRANYGEITNKDISVRGNDRYAIYSLGENVLFDVGKSNIRKSGEANLQQIATSLNQRYNDGDIRIYGHTDSAGDGAQNRQLAQQRAAAVKTWLQTKAKISSDHISIHPLGESQPPASNSTEEGRQQNRSVEIVARKH